MLQNMIRRNDAESNFREDKNLNILKETIRYIETNYRHNISISDLSLNAGISKYHMCHLFKRMTGITVTDYINQHRIGKATLLMQDRSRKIIDVALEVGFNNVSYFTKVFKKIIGCSPREYQRSHLGRQTV